MPTSDYNLNQTSIYNVEYNIPRHVVGVPGRQNRTGDGRMKITPGMAEPMEFIWGNTDGVPIGLAPFTVKLMFWLTNRFRDTSQTPNLATLTMAESDIVLAKAIEVPQPHTGRATIMLVGADTMKFAFVDITSVRWGLFLINSDGEVFPTQITSSGGRYGTVIVDLPAGLPPVDLIKSEG